MRLLQIDERALSAVDVGRAIRIVRLAKGLKLSKLASDAGISIPFLSLVESGEREPSIRVLQNIADALDVPVDALLIVSVEGGKSLSTSNRRAMRLVESINRLVEAERQLREKLT